MILALILFLVLFAAVATLIQLDLVRAIWGLDSDRGQYVFVVGSPRLVPTLFECRVNLKAYCMKDTTLSLNAFARWHLAEAKALVRGRGLVLTIWRRPVR